MPWCSRCGGWSPTRSSSCWPRAKTHVAELPESLRRLVRGRAGSQLRLRGLDEEDLTDLAELMGVRRFPAQAARRLRSGTQGNPLHARALLEEFPPQEWGGDQQPLPSPRSFRLVVASRYAACTADTRNLVDGASVLGTRAHCRSRPRSGRSRSR